VEQGDSRGSLEAGDDLELQVIQRRPASSSTPPADSDRARSTLDGHSGQMPARQRRLTRIVVAAIASCALILIAAAGARLSRSKGAAATATATATATTTTTTTATTNPTAAATQTTTAPVESTTGNLILVRPAVRGYVWLDGKKITTTSGGVACGPHQIKVGSFGHLHPITVPCGGDLKVWH
jgi:hypothetical protein